MRANLSVLTLCLLLLSGCQDAAAPQPASSGMTDASLQGEWQLASIHAAGQEVSAEKVQPLNMTYSFVDKVLTIRRSGKPDDTCSFAVDTNSSPHRIVLEKSPAIYGIYAVEGDQLQLCIMVDEAASGQYPGSLVSSTKPATDLLVFQRKSGAPTTVPASENPQTPPASPSPASNNPDALAGRTIWSFKDVPKVFPDQTEFSGAFRKGEGKAWYSEKADGSFYHDYEEVVVTPEYVEIMWPGGGFIVRLYDDHSDYRFGNQPNFERMFAGQWQR